MAKWGVVGLGGRYKPYTVCICGQRWLYNSKIDETSTCYQCGAYFQAAWRAPEGPKHLPEAASYLEVAKRGALSQEHKRVKEKFEALQSEGGRDTGIALLRSLYPDLLAPPPKKTPLKLYNETQQALYAAQARHERAFDKAADLAIRLEDAQAEAQRSMEEVAKAEKAMAEARAAHAKHTGTSDPTLGGGAGLREAGPAHAPAASPVNWWEVKPPDGQGLEGPLAEMSGALQPHLLAFGKAMEEHRAASQAAKKRKADDQKETPLVDGDGDAVIAGAGGAEAAEEAGPAPPAAPTVPADAPAPVAPPAAADGAANGAAGVKTRQERVKEAREKQIAKAKNSANIKAGGAGDEDSDL